MSSLSSLMSSSMVKNTAHTAQNLEDIPEYSRSQSQFNVSRTAASTIMGDESSFASRLDDNQSNDKLSASIIVSKQSLLGSIFTGKEAKQEEMTPKDSYGRNLKQRKEELEQKTQLKTAKILELKSKLKLLQEQQEKMREVLRQKN